MALNLVASQGGADPTNTTHTLTVTSTGIATGTGLILAISTRIASGTTANASVSDNKGNTWVHAVTGANASSQTNQSEIWHVEPGSYTSGVTTLTVTVPLSATLVWFFYEVSGGLTGSSWQDQTIGTASASSTTNPSATTGTLGQAATFAVGAIGWSSTSTTISALTAGWTLDALEGQTSPNVREQPAHQITSATTALTYAGTLSATSRWAVVIATFRQGVSGPQTLQVAAAGQSTSSGALDATLRLAGSLYTVSPGAAAASADINQFRSLLIGGTGSAVSTGYFIPTGNPLTIRHGSTGPTLDHRIVGAVGNPSRIGNLDGYGRTPIWTDGIPDGSFAAQQGDVLSGGTRGGLDICRVAGTPGSWVGHGSGQYRMHAYLASNFLTAGSSANLTQFVFFMTSNDDPSGSFGTTTLSVGLAARLGWTAGSTGQGQWFPPITGWYRITACVTFIAVNNPQQSWVTFSDGFPTEILRGEAITARGVITNDAFALTLSGRAYLTANQEAYLSIFNGGGNGINLLGGPQYTWLDIEFEGFLY